MLCKENKPQSTVADWDTGKRHHSELPLIYASLQKQRGSFYLRWETSVDLYSDRVNTKSVIADEGSCKTRPNICGCISPLWLTTAAACLHRAAGASPVHVIFSRWSLTESPSFGSIGLCEIRDSMVKRTRLLTGLRGEERPPNTTMSPPGKEVAVWYSLTSAGEQMICHTHIISWQEAASRTRLLTELSTYLHADRSPAFTALHKEPWCCPPTCFAGAPCQKDPFRAQQAGSHAQPLHTEWDGSNTQDREAARGWGDTWNCRPWGKQADF